MNSPVPSDRPDKIDDILRLYRLVRKAPLLPMPTVSPARATFDYRHIVHAEQARESVAYAAAVLVSEFGVAFGQAAEPAGDDTPRYLLEALLESGLTLVIISRFAQDADQDEREDAGRLVAA